MNIKCGTLEQREKIKEKREKLRLAKPYLFLFYFLISLLLSQFIKVTDSNFGTVDNVCFIVTVLPQKKI